MNYKTMPFYMTYPLPMYYEEEDKYMRDLEYLQQMYPSQAKRYQKRIAEILDKLDHEGSMIYDEYPDKLLLYKLTQDVVRVIGQEQSAAGEMAAGESEWPEQKSLEEFIQVLLFYEIYKRRHNKQRGMLKF